MSDVDKIFAGSIPDIYDEFLVPLIFEHYALDLAERVAAMNPASVLETAAGSGVVTRALAPRLDTSVRYVVTDLNQPMLDRAARQQDATHRIEWQQADALQLPFDDESFEVVCCQFGVMFFPDKVAGYQSANRALREGGHFIFNVWDRIEENDFANSVTDTVSRLFPDDPPVFLARTPHGYHNVNKIESDLQVAGFDRVEIHTISEVSRASTPRHPAIAYCQGTPLRNELETRGGMSLDAVTDQAAGDLEHKFGASQISGKIQGHVITAIK